MRRCTGNLGNLGNLLAILPRARLNFSVTGFTFVRTQGG
jgi:hypothetical protein